MTRPANHCIMLQTIIEPNRGFCALQCEKKDKTDVKDLLVRRTQDPYLILERARSQGWQSIETVPLAGDGVFQVVTIKGLVRLARNRSVVRKLRRADGWGPARATVVAVESGNYLGAIAWRWPDE